MAPPGGGPRQEGLLVRLAYLWRARVARPRGGVADDQDLPALYSMAAAVPYLSLYEGFGFPVLEAQACGAPVLCADSSSLPEVAGEAALLVNPEDTGAMTAAIRRLVSDPLLRHQLAQAGLENVRRFTWGETAVQVLQVLEKAALTIQ